MAERGTDIKFLMDLYRNKKEKPGGWQQKYTLELELEYDLKYGDNPNQAAAIYIATVGKLLAEKVDLLKVNSEGKGKGGLSGTNLADVLRALEVLKYISGPAAAVMKHNLVAGFAKQVANETQAHLYRTARDCDRRSCFGGAAVFNRPLEMDTVEALLEFYRPKEDKNYRMDVVAAPGFASGVVGKIESTAKDIRIAEFSNIEALPKFVGDDTYGLLSAKELPSGRMMLQDLYLSKVRGKQDLILDGMIVDKEGTKHAVARDPTYQELDDLLTSWYLNLGGARSNGIVFVRNGVAVAVGCGQQERVGAVEQAVTKALQKAMDREGIAYNPLFGITGHEKLKDNPLIGAVASSDGFFPYRDSIDVFGPMGVKAVIQPGGSVNDKVVIDAANEHKMAMVVTGERCFGHF